MEMSVRTGSETAENADSPLPRQQREPLRTWAGHGTGVPCNGCGQTIQAHEIEYEVEMPPGSDALSLNFHLACYRSWAGRNKR
jgi:hypothetical protein